LKAGTDPGSFIPKIKKFDLSHNYSNFTWIKRLIVTFSEVIA